MRKLWKSTIVIWSEVEVDPHTMELDELGRAATSGDAYCSKMVAEIIENPEKDPDWDGTDFFADEFGVLDS